MINIGEALDWAGKLDGVDEKYREPIKQLILDTVQLDRDLHGRKPENTHAQAFAQRKIDALHQQIVRQSADIIGLRDALHKARKACSRYSNELDQLRQLSK